MAIEMSQPYLLAGRWVYADVDREEAETVDLHVSIGLGSPDESPVGEELQVELHADGEQLQQIVGPEASAPLPVIETKGATAFGEYSFENPSGARPTALVVSFRGEKAVFDLGSNAR